MSGNNFKCRLLSSLLLFSLEFISLYFLDAVQVISRPLNPIIGGGPGRPPQPNFQTFYCHFSRKCRKSLKLGDFSQNDVEIFLRTFLLKNSKRVWPPEAVC